MVSTNEQTKLHFKRQRWLILTHYGGNPPKCACCGESHYEFLTIDHICGGGIKHRLQISGLTKDDVKGLSVELLRGKGYDPRKFTKWIIENNFPEGFRILCYNCNCAIGHYGYCPHSGKTTPLPESSRLEVIDPEKWVGSPSGKIKSKEFHLKSSSIEYCRNCGGQFRKSGSIINQEGFCRKICHDEWRERERKRIFPNRTNWNTPTQNY